MQLTNILKVNNETEKLDRFFQLIDQSETPLLINDTYVFTDSICENEVAESRTDIFAKYTQFECFDELLYSPKKSTKTFTESEDAFFQKLKKENESCADLVHLPIPSHLLPKDSESKEADLSAEISKLGYNVQTVDVVYFFDLLLSKNFRYLMKEPISHMFYDNIFIHNKSKSPNPSFDAIPLIDLLAYRLPRLLQRHPLSFERFLCPPIRRVQSLARVLLRRRPRADS